MGRLLGILVLHGVVAASYCVALLSPELVSRLGREDGLIENYGALSLFAASAFFGWTYAHSRGRGNDFRWFKTQRNILVLMLALAFFLAGGEEISWGQRIFGWDTPEAIEAANLQGETNLHNLAALQNLIPVHTVFNLFWLAYGVALPLLNRFALVRAWLRRIGLPVAPTWIATLFVLSYVSFNLVAARFGLDSAVRHALNELKESNAGLVCAVLSWCVLATVLRQPEKPGTGG